MVRFYVPIFKAVASKWVRARHLLGPHPISPHRRSHLSLLCGFTRVKPIARRQDGLEPGGTHDDHAVNRKARSGHGLQRRRPRRKVRILLAHITGAAQDLEALLHKHIYKAHANARVDGDIAHACGRGDIGDDQMFGVKNCEYLFGRDIGLAVGVHGGKPAEDAGLGGGLEFGGDHG